MKVLFIINQYVTNAGASRALRAYMLNNKELEEPVAFCQHLAKKDSDPTAIQKAAAEDILDYYLEHRYQCIHYFRSNQWELFEQLMKAARRRGIRLPVLTTVCQQPDHRRIMLRPYEIAHSDMLVFIDKAAYNCPLYSFIPEERKSMIYCSFGTKSGKEETMRLADQAQKTNSIPVVGRASSLNKCPDDMFEVYDQLDEPKKILVIGGDDIKTTERIKAHCAKRKGSYEVEMTGLLPFDEYMKRMTEIDIFLYHLRTDAYSSLDATLGTAMLMKKPCVYMGPPAPTERFEHGFNGFVAHSKEELVKYTNMLLRDPALRERMGANARMTTLRDFTAGKTFHDYNELYGKIAACRALPRIPSPFSLHVSCFFHTTLPQAWDNAGLKFRRLKQRARGKILSIMQRATER